MASAMAAGGGVIGAFGAIASGNAQYNSLQEQANIEEANASEAREAGNLNATRQSIVAGRQIGQTEADFAASGVSGASVMDVLAASHQNAELDRLNILHGAELRAINYQNQASLDRIGAQSARNASYFNAVSSLMGGGARAAGYGNGVTPYSQANEVDSYDAGYTAGGDGGSAEKMTG